MAPYLLVGLGNPGATYHNTRHNIGFTVLDALAQAHGQGEAGWQHKASFKGLIQRLQWQGHTVWLLKPQTYMNLSGESVQPMAHYYNVPIEQIIVVVDDVALPLGKLRVRPSGSDGGQNGLKSLIKHLGSQGFGRLRVGIGPQPQGMPLERFVLQAFSADEADKLAKVVPGAITALGCWLTHGVEVARNQTNGLLL
jgi:PTH1 family peptidyl-tRNA hydrolase